MSARVARFVDFVPRLMLKKQHCLPETGSASILRCKFVAAPVGRDRYKETFSVLNRRIRITRSLYIKLKKLNGIENRLKWEG
jgi:hypothetical protein